MHEIIELEKRWFRYKLKRWIVPLTTITLSIVALAFFFLIDFSQLFVSNSTKPNQTALTLNNNEIQEPKDVEITKKEETQAPKEKISDVENRQFMLQAYEPIINLPKKQSAKVEKKPQEPTPKQQTAQAPKEEVITTQAPQANQSSATFERSDNQMDPQSIEQRFNETNNIRHAIFLAKYYYDNKDYDKSYKWAFTVNQLDPISEEGWIYFAKSLYKLERKDDAIQVLRSYLNHYRSSTAQETLRKIIQGVL